MIIAETKSLFAWDCLKDNPSLKTIREFIGSIPDAKLLRSLRAGRGKGRDDYPVHVLWGTLLLKIALRHTHTESCLAELHRNEGLRQLIGIKSEAGVPKPWNMTRFCAVLGTEPHLTHLQEIFTAIVAELGQVVDDLGTHTAGDATGLSARGDRGGDVNPDSLPQPSGGRKEYTDEDGNVVRAIEWFGYKLHVLVDTRHEVILSYWVSSPKTGDNEGLPELVGRAKQALPEKRIATLAYDKAADDTNVHEVLRDNHIKPVIRNRHHWKDEPERPLPGHEGGNIVYNEAGTVYCYDVVSDAPVRHKMAYIGYEPATERIKYRCPARHSGWNCPCEERCNAGRKYGKTVRVDCTIDLRRFPPIPRATKTFERLYRGRTAVERAIARLKIFWGADDGNITTAARFHAHIGAVMIVHIAVARMLAAAPRRTATLSRTSLTPIARALRHKDATPA
jgi:hypothetical protein